MLCQLLNLLVIFCQVPFLFGVTALEKAAFHVIHLIFKRTGRHLFLCDNDVGRPPLLKRMVEDDGELQFLYVTEINKLHIGLIGPVFTGFCSKYYCILMLIS